MAGRTNAASELTRFWLQARHGCLVNESIPVKVVIGRGGGNSDIDLVAIRTDLTTLTLPNGELVGPRVIVETKDEHDWEPTGREFGQLLKKDVEAMDGQRYIPQGKPGVKFTMLRQEHYEKAVALFGTAEFDRLLVVHALDPQVLAQVGPMLEQHRIHWLTIPAMVADLLPWYAAHQHLTELRQSLVGDLLHLLVGFCHLSAQPVPSPSTAPS
jgi:hypothetical protein